MPIPTTPDHLRKRPCPPARCACKTTFLWRRHPTALLRCGLALQARQSVSSAVAKLTFHISSSQDCRARQRLGCCQPPRRCAPRADALMAILNAVPAHAALLNSAGGSLSGERGLAALRLGERVADRGLPRGTAFGVHARVSVLQRRHNDRRCCSATRVAPPLSLGSSRRQDDDFLFEMAEQERKQPSNPGLAAAG